MMPNALLSSILQYPTRQACSCNTDDPNGASSDKHVGLPRPLVTKSQPLNQFTIRIRVGSIQVSQVAAALTDQLKQTAP
jgi:hypothetical protein